MLRALIALTLLTPTAQAQTLESRVTGLDIVPLTGLPALPPKTEADAVCFDQTAPATPPGQALAAMGWVITAELPFGDMTAVSIMPPYIASFCEEISGNVAFFRSDRPFALLQAIDEVHQTIGSIKPLDDARVRLFSSGEAYSVPLADLHTDDAGGIEVLPLPEEQQFCDGDVQVPNIYDLPFDQARDRIFRDGWRPMPPPPHTDESKFRFTDMEGEEYDFNMWNLNDPRILEPGLCYGDDGDGVYCIFRYDQPAAELEVTVYTSDAGIYLSRAVDTMVKCY